MSTTFSPETAKKINEMESGKLSLLTETAIHLGDLAKKAEANLKDNRRAQEALNHADTIALLTIPITDELEARSSLYRPAMTFIDSEHTGLKAVAVGMLLQALSDAPDLLQLAVERLHDEYSAVVFDGEDANDPKSRYGRK